MQTRIFEKFVKMYHQTTQKDLLESQTTNQVVFHDPPEIVMFYEITNNQKLNFSSIYQKKVKNSSLQANPDRFEHLTSFVI